MSLPYSTHDSVGVRQSSLRETNLRLVTAGVLAAAHPVSRADVANATGMTRATVSRLVDELIAGRILRERKQGAPTGRGRPATPISATNYFAALGLQVNANGLAGRVIALSGEVMAEEFTTSDLRASDPGLVLARLDDLARRMIAAATDAGARVVGVGLALPGIVSTESSKLLTAPNLGWSEVEQSDFLSGPTLGGRRLIVGNEANCAAWATAYTKPGRAGPLKDFLYVSGETGIGGAAVLNGEVMSGRHGWAGEIGHISVDPAGPSCRCGSTGCLELYAGWRSLVEGSSLPATTSVSEFADKLRHGSKDEARALESAARALGIALAGAVNVLDISVIVLGGHLGELCEFLEPQLSEHLRRRVMSSRWEAPRVVAGEPDSAIATTGAALQALRELTRNPARWIDTTVGLVGS